MLQPRKGRVMGGFCSLFARAEISLTGQIRHLHVAIAFQNTGGKYGPLALRAVRIRMRQDLYPRTGMIEDCVSARGENWVG